MNPNDRPIARELRLSPRTVEAHRAEAMRKLGAGSTAGLVSPVPRQATGR